MNYFCIYEQAITGKNSKNDEKLSGLWYYGSRVAFETADKQKSLQFTDFRV
ncbi:hypothetical protein RUMHYD_02001 [Blautia hydrogenotrophica DSM 10507]|uniref:Uncharacterized protein n=1 Tax=Blautia hydrogenotrophica (strain DSM 10507 / JCM 14656 / S5a33) TaxID=476272 RepID=C0CMC0_BLAHS|nr:hypothetical protein RUMHYD_02001 [Blautia hydrogenotrophica DSM 10507]